MGDNPTVVRQTDLEGNQEAEKLEERGTRKSDGWGRNLRAGN